MNLSEHPYLLSILLGIVEGLTEFLPVSSTAHLRIIKPWVGISLQDPYWKTYDVVIQLGAILAVVVYFRQRLIDLIRTFPGGAAEGRWFRHPLFLVLVACLVTAVPAYLLNRYISQNLESLLIIGTSVLVGGVAMWVVDALLGEREAAQQEADPNALRSEPRPRTQRIEDMSLLQAAWIGAVQILSAVFPGASRSMCTIAAGQIAGLTRATALEFSFFVSIPVMFAACGFHLLHALGAVPGESRYVGSLSGQEWGVLATGFVVSFLVAWGVVAWFMAWVRRHGFVPFAIYRILLGSAVVLWAL